MAKGPLVRILRIDSKFTGNGLQGLISGLGRAKTAALAFGTVMVAAGKEAVEAWLEADRAAREANTKFEGYNANTRRIIKDTSKAFSDEYNVAITDVIKVYDELGGAGVEFADSHKVVEEVLRGVRGGFSTVEPVAKIAITAIKGFGEEFDALPQIMDQVVQAVDDGIVPMDQIGHSLANVAPQAKLAGVGIEEVLAAIVFLTQKGFDATRSMTLMNRFFATLRDGSNRTGAAFEELAGKSFDEFIEQGGTVASALRLIEEHLEATGTNAADFFNLIQAQRFAEPFLGEVDKYEEGTERILNSTGTLEGRLAEAMGGEQEDFTELGAQVGLLAEEIGESLGPAIGKVISFFTEGQQASHALGDSYEFVKDRAGELKITYADSLALVNAIIDADITNAQTKDGLKAIIKDVDGLMSTNNLTMEEAIAKVKFLDDVVVHLGEDVLKNNQAWLLNNQAIVEAEIAASKLSTTQWEAAYATGASKEATEEHTESTNINRMSLEELLESTAAEREEMLLLRAAQDGFVASAQDVPPAIEDNTKAMELFDEAAATHRQTLDVMATHYSTLATNILISVDAILAGAAAWDELTIAQQANEQLGLSNVPTNPDSRGTGRPSANIPEDGDPQNSGNQDPTQWSGGGFR